MDNMDNFQNQNNAQGFGDSSASQNSSEKSGETNVNNVNQESNIVKEPAPVKKKKKRSKLFILVEVVLMLVVVFLILLFLNNSGFISLNFIKFSKKTTTPTEQIQTPGTQDSTSDNWSGAAITPSQPSMVAPGSREAMELATSPRLSLPVPPQSPVSTEDQVPEGAIKIYGTEFGFEPFEFTVRAGEEVTLALVSQVDVPTILTFYEATMPAISIGCGPRETRWITFNAPDQPGEYTFKNDAIGRNNQTGRMIVN